MLNVKISNGEIQNLVEAGVVKVTSGDKIQVSVDEGSSYQVLIAENQSDVILQVTNSDGSTYDVVLEGLSSLYEAGDVITQLLLEINGEEMLVSNMGDLLGALDATAAGGAITQGRSFAEDNPNIDPNRSAADDSDQLRSDGGINALGVGIEANEQPVVSDVFLVQNEIQGVEAAGDLNIITGQLTATDPNFGDTHTFSMVAGTLSVTDTNGVITLLDDSVTAIVNPDGTYTISGNFNDLSDGEIATVTFDYIATDAGGLSSVPATVSFAVTGTNDIPVVEAINVNGPDLWSLVAEGATLSTVESLAEMGISNDGSFPTDGSAIKFTIQTEANEQVSFNWDFLDNDWGTGSFNDFSFVVIDGNLFTLEDSLDTDVNGNTVLSHLFDTSGVHTLTFGVMNSGDTVLDSALNINYISGGKLINVETVGTASFSSIVFYETYDSEDILGIDDTQDESTNFFTGVLSVADDDVMNDGLHTFHVLQDDQNNNIVEISGTTVVTADDITVGTVQNLDGSWNYTIDGDFSALAAGETATVTFQYYADDTRGFDGTDGINESSLSEPKTVTLTITGTNDQPIVQDISNTISESHDSTDVLGVDDTQEDILTTFNSSLATATDDDVNDTHTYSQDGVESIDNPLITDYSVVVNSDGTYTIEGDFNPLAAGETATVTFQYTATDSSTGSEENNTSEPKTVTLTITGTNDQPVVTDVTVVGNETINVDMDGNALNGTTTVLTGSFIVADDDVNNSHEYVITGLPENTGSQIEIGGVSYSVIPVLVGSTNTETTQNQALVALRVVGSDEVTLDDIKNLSIQVDGDNFTLSGDFEGLPAGVTLDIKFQYVVNDLEGFNGTDGLNETSLSETAWATVTITGTNDVPTMTVDSGSVVEDLILTVSGKVEIEDTDVGESEVQADSITGTYGDFVIDTNGNWTYVLAASGARAEAVQALGEGETVQESFNVTSEDGSLTKQVVINVIGQNDAPELTYEAINETGINETQAGELLGILSVDDVDGTPAVSGFSITGSDATLVEVVENNGVFELRVKEGANIDFEQPNHQLDILVQYNDGDDYSAAHMVNVTVNDITGVVTTIPATTLFSQTFDGHFNNEGWHLSNLGISETGGVLGNINHDNVVASNTFDLSSQAGETVSIEFDLNYGANWLPFANSNWEGNDTFEVTVSNGDTSSTYTYSPNGNGDLHIAFTTEVPDDGQLNIELTSSNTSIIEYWSIDDFTITTQEQEVLTFDTSSQGEIDMATLLDQSNDFENENGDSVSNPDSLDEINLSEGTHILSNLSVEDFLAMTDDDKTLKITADSNDGDKVDLSSDWVAVGNGSPDADGYVAYTGASDTSLQLLIDENIDVDIV